MARDRAAREVAGHAPAGVSAPFAPGILRGHTPVPVPTPELSDALATPGPLVLALLGHRRPRCTPRSRRSGPGRLIDPVAGTAAQDQVILVEGKKIKAVGKNVAIPRGATVIDLSGSTVMPGLFDAHTHLCMTVSMQRDAGNYYYTTLNDPDSYRRSRGSPTRAACWRRGSPRCVTSGTRASTPAPACGGRSSRGLVDGPTIINAGRIIAPYGGQFQLQPDKRRGAGDARVLLRRHPRRAAEGGAGEHPLRRDGHQAGGGRPAVHLHARGHQVRRRRGRQGGPQGGGPRLDQGRRPQRRAGRRRLDGAPERDLRRGSRAGQAERRRRGVHPVPAVGPGDLPGRQRRAARNTSRRSTGSGPDTRPVSPSRSAPTPSTTSRAPPAATLAITWIDSYIDAGLPPQAILQAMTINAARLLGVEKQRGTIGARTRGRPHRHRRRSAGRPPGAQAGALRDEEREGDQAEGGAVRHRFALAAG